MPGKVRDIYFNNVRVRLLGEGKRSMDKRPCKGEGFIKANLKEMQAMKVPLVTENATVTIE